MTPDVIFVLGMHRSGTSALTRGLQALGVRLGDNLLPPVFGDNDKGYFEDSRLHDIDNMLLAAMDRTWDSLHPPDTDAITSSSFISKGGDFLRAKSSGGIPFALKDPRLCLLLPWWLQRCEELGLRSACILAVRHPLSVVNSVCRPGTSRGEMQQVKALWLWYLHMTCALRFSQGLGRLAVNYDCLLEDPGSQLTRIQSALHLPAGEPESDYLDDFLESRLRHSRFAYADCAKHPLVTTHLIELYDLLDALAADRLRPEQGNVENATSKAFDFLYELAPLLSYVSRQDISLVSARQKVQASLDTCDALEERIARLDAQRIELVTEVAAMRDSRSWRLTAPLRRAGTYLKTFKPR